MTDIYPRLIVAMGDPSLSVARRYEAAALLEARHETEVLSSLIQALDDERVFDPAYERPSGSPEDPEVRLSVGERCRSMLLYTFLKVTPKSRHAYRVKDWHVWWQEHRGMTLHEIRQCVRDEERRNAAVDRR